MKKVFLFAAMLAVSFASAFADCQDGPYDLYVNGTKVATFTDAGFAPDGTTPQLNASAAIKAGDEVQFCNSSCNDFFFPQTIETGGEVDGSANFTVASNKAVCSADGCYNFWWKKIYNADKLYIGTDGNCSTTGGGTGTGTGECGDGPYDLYVNGTKVGTFADGGFAPDGTTPQLNISAAIKAGDEVQFCNSSCNQFFFPQEIETGGDVDGSANFTIATDKAVCSVDGCYNFWWKKIYNADKLYIGTDGNCGGGGGDLGGHTVDGFFLIGNWNGIDHGDGGDYANFIPENEFIDCKISKTFVDSDPQRSQCWIRAKAKLDGGTGWMFFSTDGWQGDGNQTITLYSAKYLSEIGHDGNSERWSVPTNQKLNITLKVISVNEVQLSIVPDATYASWTCSDAGIGDLTEIEKVEVELDLNAPMYDVLGRKVNADYHGIVIQNGKKFIR